LKTGTWPFWNGWRCQLHCRSGSAGAQSAVRRVGNSGRSKYWLFHLPRVFFGNSKMYKWRNTYK